MKLECLDTNQSDNNDIGKVFKYKILDNDRIDLSRFETMYQENPELAARCLHTIFFDETHKAACDYDSRCISGVSRSVEEFMLEHDMPLKYQENKLHIDSLRSGVTAESAGRELTQEEMNRLEEDLKSSCGRDKENFKYLDPSFVDSRLKSILDTVPQECKTRIESELASDLAFYSSRKQELRTEAQYSQMANSLTNAIAAANPWVESSPEVNDFKNEILCEQNVYIKTANLPQLIAGIQNSYNCGIQREGLDGEKTIDFDNGERLTRREQELYTSTRRVEEKYSLFRRGNTYFAGLNINFTSQSPEMAAEMRERAKGCFKEAAPYLSGDVGLNNQNYNMRLVFPEDYPGADTPPATTVRVSNIDRSNSTEWNKDVPCSVVIHEVLHLMGLCDEYEETSMGYSYNTEDDSYDFSPNGKDADGNTLPNFQTAYDCRALGPVDSIMANNYQAWENSLNTGSRLLSPAHFNAIIFPGCNRINENYYRCSKNAYITSSSVAGAAGNTCRSKPPECSNGNTEWITD